MLHQKAVKLIDDSLQIESAFWPILFIISFRLPIPFCNIFIRNTFINNLNLTQIK